MIFNSISFALFFPIVALVYFLIPNRARNLWLLMTSYYFYMSWNKKYIVLILFSTLITYISGLLVDRYKTNKFLAKIVFIMALGANLSVLIFFKYWNFFATTINNALLSGSGRYFPTMNVLLPVGISFYTFQALGYLIDVYRGDMAPERNIITYGLYVSFFPQLVAGPIERASNLLPQFKSKHSFDYERLIEGIYIMIWGYFLKMVVADRIAVIVDTVYGDVEGYSGLFFIVANILFAFQIYCDFSGYSLIARGCALVMGFNLMENFNCPYLAVNVVDFWRRWHISLSTWFRDYVYIPLGGNRVGKTRKYINLIIVFVVSGLWHGAGWTFVAWGLLNGIFQVFNLALRDVSIYIKNCTGSQNFAPDNDASHLDSIYSESEQKEHIRGKSPVRKSLSCLITFVLVDFAWMFFRADSIKTVWSIIKGTLEVFDLTVLLDGSLYELGLNEQNFKFMVYSVILLIFVDILAEKGISVRKYFLGQGTVLRAFTIAFSILFISLFGMWGYGYEAAGFIYFQF